MVDEAFDFDTRTGLLRLYGYTYHPVAQNWVPDLDTNIGYYMYTYDTYNPSFCGYDHSGG